MKRALFGVVILLTLAGCKAGETCSVPITCGNGSYRTCSNGASCRLVASDGSSFACRSCGDCASASTAAIAWCGAGTSVDGGAGDPASTGGDDMGAGSASYPETQACIDYLACAEQYQPARYPSLVGTYGPDGTCWQSTRTVATSCDAACASALATAGSDPSAPAVCRGARGGDMAVGGRDMGGGGDMTPGADLAPPYHPTSISLMRTQGLFGAFELDRVVVVAVGPTGSRAYVQDPGGGDYSAIELACSATSTTHPCSLQSTLKTVAVGHAVTVWGTYVKASAANGGYEEMYLEDLIDDGVATQRPAPAQLTYAAAVKTAQSRAQWFQKVVVTPGDDLVMFDYAPPELTRAGAGTCPYQFGFGMVPKTGAPALTSDEVCDPSCATSACAAGATPQPATSASELLVGTDFYTSFTWSSDCRCLAQFGDTAPTSSQSIPSTKTLAGVLIYDAPPGASGYQYVAPTAAADFPLQ